MIFSFLKYSYQHWIAGKKRTLTEMTTRCHSLSLVVTCRHSLSLIATSCHSLYHLLSFVVIITRLSFYQRSKENIYRSEEGTWMNGLTKLKMFKKNLESCFSKLTFDFNKTVLHQGYIIAEYFDFFGESYFTKYHWLLVRGIFLFSERKLF